MPDHIQSDIKIDNESSWRYQPVVISLALLISLTMASSLHAVCREGCDTTNDNTFLGDDALLSNSTGIANIAMGNGALRNNTTGFSNTAVGSSALALNNTGEVNMASGAGALFFNTTGTQNTASGGAALFNNIAGNNNTAIGADALFNNTTGSSNIALGESAGINLTTGKNNIDIGNSGKADESGKIRIGNKAQKNTFIAGISGVTVASGVGVIINTDGQLGTVTSSARFKETIKPMATASEAILGLQPVTFRYKHELDPNGILQFGLVAEEVARVSPDLVARDEEGKPNTVRYEAVNAMLLNEFLKEHRKVQELETSVAQLRAAAAQQSELQTTVAKLQAALRNHAAQLQKVSERVEADRSKPRVAAND